MKIMMSAGEASGDLHGARLAREMLEMEPEVKLFGFGGAKMAEAGVRLVRDCRDYSLMGVWEVVLGLGRLLQLEKTLVKAMREEKPDLLLIIDYPDFNWRLAAKAKALGIPVFSYIPPSAWAWRKGRAKKCAAIAKEIVTIFHHEIGPAWQPQTGNLASPARHAQGGEALEGAASGDALLPARRARNRAAGA